MRLFISIITLWSFSALSISPGLMAPDFTLTGAKEGKAVSLKDYRGKIVVLEWLNHGCPFVRKHYDSGNMQALQKKHTAGDVVWLSINSSAPGKQGHSDVREARELMRKYNSAATNVLLDPSGKVGKMYGAKVTPHMFIIDSHGTLVFAGAIDDKPDTDQSSVAAAKNYVDQALSELKSAKLVSVKSTKAYGCGIKYE